MFERQGKPSTLSLSGMGLKVWMGLLGCLKDSSVNPGTCTSHSSQHGGAIGQLFQWESRDQMHVFPWKQGLLAFYHFPSCLRLSVHHVLPSTSWPTFSYLHVFSQSIPTARMLDLPLSTSPSCTFLPAVINIAEYWSSVYLWWVFMGLGSFCAFVLIHPWYSFVYTSLSPKECKLWRSGIMFYS